METQEKYQFSSTDSMINDTKNQVNTGLIKLTEADIKAWLVSYLAEILEISQEEIDTKIPFNRYGLDSSATVGLAGDLENWLEQELDAALVYNYPTIEALTQHLASLSKSYAKNLRQRD
jgi:acyl carrier protein